MIGAGVLRAAGRFGRRTIEDAADLGAVAAQMAGHQARDVRATVRRLARRCADDARRSVRR